MEKIRFILSGRVQGVGFRRYVLRQAERLGVNGWVRNNIDGSVEVFSFGPSDAMVQFFDLCVKGPLFGKVIHYTLEELTEADKAADTQGFRIV